jgi:hypothetical protein
MNDQINKNNRTKEEIIQDKMDDNVRRMASLQSLGNLDNGKFLGFMG